ncbi:DUF3800 domain-containing protein [Georgenia sp. H159]|uniref:DUF3800 domain-containing protein n=1 Tax=Georgenia sp. H159 TaxID=3076115 RepID=UPI002D778F33|nr:DUF3800 domain-containing protein [Georgenia sp. H159]
MLIAYLDEFGHVGPYISRDHRKFNNHPLFGYGGFVADAKHIRSFGGYFERIKERTFSSEIEAAGAHPRRWEKKGADLLTQGSWDRFSNSTTRMLHDLSRRLCQNGGRFFYYGEAKPVGSAKETGQSSSDRSGSILSTAISRLATFADLQGDDLLIFLDQVDDKQRDDAITRMASFIYSKSSPPETARVLEVPMQIESVRYGAMQFADWYCALISRATTCRFVESDLFPWSVSLFREVSLIHGTTAGTSRVWLPRRQMAVSAQMLAKDQSRIHVEQRVTEGQNVGAAHPQLMRMMYDLRSRE